MVMGRGGAKDPGEMGQDAGSERKAAPTGSPATAAKAATGARAATGEGGLGGAGGDKNPLSLLSPAGGMFANLAKQAVALTSPLFGGGGHGDAGAKSPFAGMFDSDAKGAAKGPGAAMAGALAGAAKQAAAGSKTGSVAPALESAAAGESPAQQLKKVDRPVSMPLGAALEVTKDLKRQQPGGGGKGGSEGGSAGGEKPATDAKDPAYRTPFASAYFTGITEEAEGAKTAAEHVLGNQSGVALYDGKHPSGDLAKNPNESGADVAYDALAVTQFGRIGEGVQIGKDGKLQVDKKALSEQVQIGGADGEKYMTALEVGQKGADAALASNPELAKKLQGGDPRTDPKLAGEFINITGHSGGGQSSFYAAIELYQRGFRNVSVVGYEMAMTPHQRETLEKLGIPVTNISSHQGGKDNYVKSAVGDAIRSSMGGDLNYYDASLDLSASKLGDTHGVLNHDRVTTMLRYAAWLDSQGKHQQFGQENYDAFLKATGGKGDDIKGQQDGKVHNSESPLAGSFLDQSKTGNPAIYGQTPALTGRDLLNGLGVLSPIGGLVADRIVSSFVPQFADSKLPQLDVGISPNIQAQGSIDLKNGAAQGGINLSGTAIDVPFGHVTLPDWAQAGGGVNLSQGAANVNLGGKNGVGADVNLAQGNLDLNIGGHKIDVDQGLRDIGGGISNFVGGLFGR